MSVLKRQLEKGKNSEFWIKKISRNRERDEEINKQLMFMGWTVIRFWGKDIKKDVEQCVKVVEETIFENRMHIYYDLIESGVTCTINHNKAIVEGTQHILSKNYKAYDLRHGAALMILALLGDKESVISNFEYVLRGYDDMLNKIKSLGGKVSILN